MGWPEHCRYGLLDEAGLGTGEEIAYRDWMLERAVETEQKVP